MQNLDVVRALVVGAKKIDQKFCGSDWTQTHWGECPDWPSSCHTCHSHSLSLCLFKTGASSQWWWASSEEYQSWAPSSTCPSSVRWELTSTDISHMLCLVSNNAWLNFICSSSWITLSSHFIRLLRELTATCGECTRVYTIQVGIVIYLRIPYRYLGWRWFISPLLNFLQYLFMTLKYPERSIFKFHIDTSYRGIKYPNIWVHHLFNIFIFQST